MHEGGAYLRDTTVYSPACMYCVPACTWQGPIRPKLRLCISEMKNLCLYWVIGQRNSKALFWNHFHELYTCSPQSSDWYTGCWGLWTYKILTHESPTDSCESRYQDSASLNTLLHSTTRKSKTPKHKKAITNIVDSSTPESHTHLPYKIDRLLNTMQNRWPAWPHCTKGQDGGWLTEVSCQDPPSPTMPLNST